MTAASSALTRRSVPRRVLVAAGQRYTDRIEHADLGPMHGVLREVFVFDGGDALREFDGDGHEGLLGSSWMVNSTPP